MIYCANKNSMVEITAVQLQAQVLFHQWSIEARSHDQNTFRGGLGHRWPCSVSCVNAKVHNEGPLKFCSSLYQKYCYTSQCFTHLDLSVANTTISTLTTIFRFSFSMPPCWRQPEVRDIMFLVCPFVCPILVNVICEEQFEGISSYLVQTFIRIQGWTDLILVVKGQGGSDFPKHTFFALWTQYLKYVLSKFLQVWYKKSLGLNWFVLVDQRSRSWSPHTTWS